MNEATQEFMDAVCSMGGLLTATCICGMYHYAGGEEHWYDDGEWNRLEAAHKAFPELYRYHDCDSVYVATVNGMNYVVDCPCGRLAGIEELFWRLKNPLLEYYRLRIEREKREASSTDEALKALSGCRTMQHSG